MFTLFIFKQYHRHYYYFYCSVSMHIFYFWNIEINNFLFLTRILTLMLPHTKGLKEGSCPSRLYSEPQMKSDLMSDGLTPLRSSQLLLPLLFSRECHGRSVIQMAIHSFPYSPLFCFWVGRWPPFATGQSRESRLRSHMRTRGRVICWYPAW